MNGWVTNLQYLCNHVVESTNGFISSSSAFSGLLERGSGISFAWKWPVAISEITVGTKVLWEHRHHNLNASSHELASHSCPCGNKKSKKAILTWTFCIRHIWGNILDVLLFSVRFCRPPTLFFTAELGPSSLESTLPREIQVTKLPLNLSGSSYPQTGQKCLKN